MNKQVLLLIVFLSSNSSFIQTSIPTPGGAAFSIAPEERVADAYKRELLQLIRENNTGAALFYIHNKHKDMVLIKDETDNTALHTATQEGNLAVVQALLDLYPDELLENKNRRGKTALWISIEQASHAINTLKDRYLGHTYLQIMQLLIDKGACKDVAILEESDGDFPQLILLTFLARASGIPAIYILFRNEDLDSPAEDSEEEDSAPSSPKLPIFVGPESPIS